MMSKRELKKCEEPSVRGIALRFKDSYLPEYLDWYGDRCDALEAALFGSAHAARTFIKEETDTAARELLMVLVEVRAREVEIVGPATRKRK